MVRRKRGVVGLGGGSIENIIASDFINWKVCETEKKIYIKFVNTHREFPSIVLLSLSFLNYMAEWPQTLD